MHYYRQKNWCYILKTGAPKQYAYSDAEWAARPRVKHVITVNAQFDQALFRTYQYKPVEQCPTCSCFNLIYECKW